MAHPHALQHRPDTVDRHASERPDAIAVIHEDEAGRVQRLTYAEVRDRSMRLANVLDQLGLAAGDRVAILLPQRPETGIAHLAAYRAGQIAMPLFVLFMRRALRARP